MISFILIILFTPYGQPSAALSVPDFLTEADCKAALVVVQANFQAKGTCVSQTKK